MNGLEGFGAQTADASQRKPLPAAKPASKGGESQEPAAAQSAPDAPREGSAQPTSETPAAPAQDGQKKTSSFSDVIGEVEVQVEAEGGDPVQTTQLPTPTLPQLPLNPEGGDADPATPEIAAATRYDLDQLGQHFNAGLPTLCRRLTALDPETHPQFGYLAANAAGNLIEHLGLEELSLPRYGIGCPLWILYRAQGAPDMIHPQSVVLPGDRRFLFLA